MKYDESQDSLGQYTPQKKVHTNGLTLSVPSVNRKNALYTAGWSPIKVEKRLEIRLPNESINKWKTLFCSNDGIKI